MAMKENSKRVLEYLKGIGEANVTASDIAEALDLEVKSVNGIVTSALQKKGLSTRTAAEVEVTNEDGTVGHKTVKFIKLTEAGMNFDPDAEEAK